MTAEELVRYARLAALDLDEGSLRARARDVERILDAFEALERAEAALGAGGSASGQEVDDSLPSVGPDHAPLRADVPHVPLPRREALAAAPDARQGAFAVPRFVHK